MRNGLLLPGLLAGVAVLAAFGLLAERSLRTIRLEAEARVHDRLQAEVAGATTAAGAALADADPDDLAGGRAWRITAEGRFVHPPEPAPIPPEGPPEDAPSRLLFLLSQGQAAEREGDLPAAADFYGQAAGPGAPDEVSRVALARLAAVEARRDRPDAAREAWTRVADLAGDTELLPRAAAGGGEVPRERLVAWVVAHLGAGTRGVAEGYARMLGLEDLPAVRARTVEIGRMREVRRRALPLPGEDEGPRLLPLDGGPVAVQRGERIAVLESGAARDILGPLALLPGDPAPAGAGTLLVERGGEGPLAGIRFLARADPTEIDETVRGQALSLLGAVAIAAAISVAALVFLLRGARRDAELARLKTEFVANVSHELRTPLSVVRLYAETLRAGRAPEGEEDDYLAVLERESASLSRLVDRVLDFARIERGDKEYRLAPGDLAAAVRELAEEAGARHADVEIRVELPPEPVRARFDRDALAGALGNLLDNAAKHGGGGEVTLALVPNGRVARIEVRDRGPGVPPGEAERVFTRFHRGRAAVAGAVRGSGLGLTLARHAAEGNGGRIGVRPREGGGAVFWMEIPTEGKS